MVVALALAVGFVVTWLVSEEPVAAYRELLTGPLPEFRRAGLLSRHGRFCEWLEESITLVIGLAMSIVFQARQFSLGAEDALSRHGRRRGDLYLPAPPRCIFCWR